MALVDGAFDLNSKNRLLLSDSIKLFDHDELVDVIEASPYIVPLSTNELHALKLEITELSKHRDGRPMLSFFSSKYSTLEIAKRWRTFLTARSTDGGDFILRFSDTRVLEYLEDCLESNHWNGITNMIEEWLYIDRSGGVSSVNISKGDYVFSKEFLLSDFEYNNLVDFSEPDFVVNILSRDYSEVVPDKRRGKFFSDVKRICDFSKKNNVDNFRDVVGMVLFGLLSGVDIQENNEVKLLLGKREWISGNLIDSLYGLLE